jgi:hypothetical protein
LAGLEASLKPNAKSINPPALRLLAATSLRNIERGIAIYAEVVHRQAASLMRQVAAQSAGPAESEAVIASESDAVAEAENVIVADFRAQSIIAAGYHLWLPD